MMFKIVARSWFGNRPAVFDPVPPRLEAGTAWLIMASACRFEAFSLAPARVILMRRTKMLARRMAKCQERN
jgi:hypothetical protein